jgi:DNA-nicking Smr family endonuclease
MPRRRTPTQAEKALWGAATRDVRPLDPSAALAMTAAAPEPSAPVSENIVPLHPPRPAAPRVPGGVDRTTIERLKRGHVTVEGRIDLHGMDQRAAHAALMGFVDTSHRAGKRALLVITGKGAPSEGGGVLRRNAPNWLTASPLAGRILTIQPAHVRHGGDGAFYVLLRRKRL